MSFGIMVSSSSRGHWIGEELAAGQHHSVAPSLETLFVTASCDRVSDLRDVVVAAMLTARAAHGDRQARPQDPTELEPIDLTAAYETSRRTVHERTRLADRFGNVRRVAHER